MNIGCLRLAILFIGTASLCPAQQASDFGGTWVLKVNGQPIFKLTLTPVKGGITGSWTRPRDLTFDQDGDVAKIGPDHVQLPIQKAALTGGRLELSIDDDLFLLTMEDHNRALFATEGIRPWRLERTPEGDNVILASRLLEPEYPQEIRALRGQLSAMVAEDQAARMTFDQARWEAVDAKNRPEVLRIFDRYGWVTNSVPARMRATTSRCWSSTRRLRSSKGFFQPWKKRPGTAMRR